MTCNHMSYETQEQATADAIALRRDNRSHNRNRKSMKGLHSVFCERCSKWRLTSLSKPRARRMKKTQRRYRNERTS